MTVALYALERERASADQAYARMRNLLTLAVTFFGLTQAAVFAALAASVNNQPVISNWQQAVVGGLAAVALILLGLAARHVLGNADRGIEQTWVSRDDIRGIASEERQIPASVGALALGALTTELQYWENGNLLRKKLVAEVTTLVALVAGALVVELAALYVFI